MYPKIQSKAWLKIFEFEHQKEYYHELIAFLEREASNGNTYFPELKNIFTAFEKTPPDDVKVVILGQDPYHGKGQANGLSFSVPRGEKIPPSLRNIFKELNQDLNIPIPKHGDLSVWAEQGVLLLNSVLTVSEDKPGSHRNKGWEVFTDHIIHTLSKEYDHIVFILWGEYAKSKQQLIDEHKHLVLTANHPSPFSAYKGFFGCKHFSKCNAYLLKHSLLPIDWNLD